MTHFGLVVLVMVCGASTVPTVVNDVSSRISPSLVVVAT